MCGIICAADFRGALRPADLDRSRDAVRHRGPDGAGSAFFGRGLEPLPAAGAEGFFVGMGHTRLSILDLSEAGAQPMHYGDGRFWITYNGEIYNHVELRAELETLGHRFRSRCDTEVLLAAYAEWGAGCLRRLNGMWAFAILDRREGVLFASRDRLGVKPLHWVRTPSVLAFASEIKQLLLLPGVEAAPNERACVTYLATGYENPPETFFSGIQAFPPGCHATVSLREASPSVSPRRFWQPRDICPRPWRVPEAVEAVRAAFAASVRYRIRSDVPVGGCLSGGLDSSAIFVQMRELRPDTSFHAFSACFDGAPEVDERPFMRAVAERTASVWHQVLPTDAGLAQDFDALLRAHDEPFGSVSIYASYAVMRAARRASVPVLLDGQGGDELFSGYWASYFLAMRHNLASGRLLWPLRQVAGSLAPWGNPELFREARSAVAEYRRRAARRLPFTLRARFAPILDTLTWHRDAQRLTPGEYRLAEMLDIHLPRLLKWEDRNSMAHSIETRVPFLDVNLVELVLSMPPEINLADGWNKRLTRLMMRGRLPDCVCWRKDKMGFETPQSRWTREGPFHEELLRWCAEPEHPASAFVQDDFAALGRALRAGTLDATRLFRLFCLDRWMRQH